MERIIESARYQTAQPITTTHETTKSVNDLFNSRKPASHAGNQPNGTVLVIGASGRAAAMSCVRAGLVPTVVDFFADQDTRSIADVHRIRSYHDLLEKCNFPACHYVLFTGAIEHQKAVVERFLNRHKPLGNPLTGSFAIADPLHLFQWAQANHVNMPQTQKEIPRSQGRWLSKRVHSSGGIGIVEFEEEITKQPEDRFFQEFIGGTAVSVVARADNKNAVVLGCTHQLTGLEDFGAAGFKYCGSIGPTNLSETMNSEIARITNSLAKDFELNGVFGIDFVINQDSIWLIEVNPRYPASLEVLEIHSGTSMLLSTLTPISTSKRVLGKAIIYWNRERHLNWRGSEDWLLLVDLFYQEDLLELIETKIVIADVPNVGTKIKDGHPVLTVYATGSDTEQCTRSLVAKARVIFAYLESTLPID